jgi:hypothetical protein
MIVAIAKNSYIKPESEVKWIIRKQKQNAGNRRVATLHRDLFEMHSSYLWLLGLCPIFGSAAVISQRSAVQGWSLQSSTCPSGSKSCGGGACCPSSLYCFAAQTDEVASCCSSSKTKPIYHLFIKGRILTVDKRFGLRRGRGRGSKMR